MREPAMPASRLSVNQVRAVACGAFLLGALIGALAARPRAHSFPLSSVTHRSELPVGTVSHNREIKKVVLAGYNELPHVTQVAIASIQPGQEAARNFHETMAELFYVMSGTGTVELGTAKGYRNYSVRPGSVVKAQPPTPHTIWADADSKEPLEVLTIGSVPDM
jgi:mannose-6-phosphate isomerase-like protein (cupin superfamily)